MKIALNSCRKVKTKVQKEREKFVEFLKQKKKENEFRQGNQFLINKIEWEFN